MHHIEESGNIESPITSEELRRWVYRYHPLSAPRLRLFCFPYAGGGAATYRHWSKHLPDGVEVAAMQLPGQQARAMEKPYQQLAPLVAEITRVIEPLLDVPFALFGHSLGALLTYELACTVRERFALSPAMLFVSGWRAPHVPSPFPPIHHLPDSQFIEELNRRYDGIPPALLEEKDLLRLMLPGLKASITLCETYRPAKRTPLACPISAFGGRNDSMVSCADIETWRELTSAEFKVTTFAGNHFYIEDARDALLRSVAEDLSCHCLGKNVSCFE